MKIDSTPVHPQTGTSSTNGTSITMKHETLPEISVNGSDSPMTHPLSHLKETTNLGPIVLARKSFPRSHLPSPFRAPEASDNSNDAQKDDAQKEEQQPSVARQQQPSLVEAIPVILLDDASSTEAVNCEKTNGINTQTTSLSGILAPSTSQADQQTDKPKKKRKRPASASVLDAQPAKKLASASKPESECNLELLLQTIDSVVNYEPEIILLDSSDETADKVEPVAAPKKKRVRIRKRAAAKVEPPKPTVGSLPQPPVIKRKHRKKVPDSLPVNVPGNMPGNVPGNPESQSQVQSIPQQPVIKRKHRKKVPANLKPSNVPGNVPVNVPGQPDSQSQVQNVPQPPVVKRKHRKKVPGPVPGNDPGKPENQPLLASAAASLASKLNSSKPKSKSTRSGSQSSVSSSGQPVKRPRGRPVGWRKPKPPSQTEPVAPAVPPPPPPPTPVPVPPPPTPVPVPLPPTTASTVPKPVFTPKPVPAVPTAKPSTSSTKASSSKGPVASKVTPTPKVTPSPKKKPKKKKKSSASSKSAVPKPVVPFPKGLAPKPTSKPAAQASSTEQVDLVCKRTRYIGPVVRITQKSGPKKCQLPLSPHRTELPLPPFDYTLVNRPLAIEDKGGETCEEVPPGVVPGAANITKLNKLASEMILTSPENWRCSLCQRGPNESSLGELYGPYYADLYLPSAHAPGVGGGATCQTTCQPCTSTPKGASKKKKEFKKPHPLPPAHHLPPLLPQRHELWFHDHCIVWSPNVYLSLDQTLANLTPMINDAIRSLCLFCGHRGATLSCLSRQCTFRSFHFPCAQERGFHFEEGRQMVNCPEHWHQMMREKR